MIQNETGARRPAPKSVRTEVGGARGAAGRVVALVTALVTALIALAGAIPGAAAGDAALATSVAAGAATAGSASPPGERPAALPAPGLSAVPPVLETRILSLDPTNVSAEDVHEILRHGPAPRIVALQGSVPLVTMQPFADFLEAMGYPASRLVNPETGERTYSSHVDSEKVAGMVAWFYEQDGLMPMLLGHSQGGMVVVRTLYELAGAFRGTIPVWDPQRAQAEPRTTIIDPLTGRPRPVVGLQVGYAAALATGALPRILLGQWDMIPRLRKVPDTVTEFTGFVIPWDPIAGTGPRPEPYRAIGSAAVRTVTLPVSTSHIGIPQARHLAENPATRAWIDRYRPGAVPPEVADVDTTNLLHAADIWHSVRRHWAAEAQKLIRARRAVGRAVLGGS